MSASSIPDREADRREAALAECGVMDTPAEPVFDELVHEAAHVCRTPMAVMSLLDRRRQWFKARVGVELTETPIEHAVCHLTVSGETLLVIPDLTKDLRTAANPLVTGEPHVRFYAGAPIRLADGLWIGSLCVVDTIARPQGLSTWQADQMLQLAGRAELLLAERRQEAHAHSRSSPPAPRRSAQIEKDGLLDLREYAQRRDLSAAEELLRLTAHFLAKRRE